MAGSYNHVTARDGALLDNAGFLDMIDTRGDAYEAVEEMYGMIWFLADALGAATETKPSVWVERARAGYKKGIERSPGTDGQLDAEEES